MRGKMSRKDGIALDSLRPINLVQNVHPCLAGKGAVALCSRLISCHPAE